MYNVGNTDAGDYLPVVCGVANNCLNSYEEGVYTYINLIKGCYFHENEEIKIETFIERDFRAVRCNIKGKRYMTDTRALTKYREKLDIMLNIM
jgi:hypothetical protein